MKKKAKPKPRAASYYKKGIKKKGKPNFITGLKELTNWISSKGSQVNNLENIIDTYNIQDNIYKRLLSYIYFNPHLLHYYNTYLNNKFEMGVLFGSKVNKRINTSKLIQTFKYILIKNNCCDRYNFTYVKSNSLKDKNRDTVKKVLTAYFDVIYNISLNKSELNFYYTLFDNGVITDIQIMKADQLLNGGKSTIKLENEKAPEVNIDRTTNVQHNVQHIQEPVQQQYSNKNNGPQIDLTNVNIPDENIIKEISDDLTFFDVREINRDTIVKVFIDSKGCKKYLFEPFVLTTYINNVDFKECKMISTEVTHKVKIQNRNKFYISKLLRDQINDLKG